MDKKISVVIPVYNTKKYIKRCLDSVLTQNLKEIEIIIVNDGSTDDSLEIIHQYASKDERIIVIDKKNGGLSSARNAGIEIATGEYIINIDSDDWIEKNYFYDMYEKAKKNNLDIVISDAIWDWDNGKIEIKKDYDVLEDDVISGNEYFEKFLNFEIFPCVWNKLYKRKLYELNNIAHPEGISLGEDLATTPKLAYYAKRIGKINKSYVHYIQNPTSIMKDQVVRKFGEILKVLDILEEFSEDKINYQKFQLFKLKILSPYVYSNYDVNNSYYDDLVDEYLECIKKLDKSFSKNLMKFSKKIGLFYLFLKKNPNKNNFKRIYLINLHVTKFLKALALR